jgi:ABC-type transport system involved in multi-copper enzyme maturation permease subunit
VLVTFRYIVLTAVRDRLMVGLSLALLGAVVIAAFLGESTFMEERQTALTFAGFSTRLILIAGLILFVCFNVQRSFENREVDLMLSRPVSRTQYVLITWAGFSGVALFMALIAVILLPIAGMPPGGALGLWAASLLLEALIVVAVALFFSLSLRSAVASAMASFGFYLVARMEGFLLGVVQADWNATASQALGSVISKTIYVVGLVMPRLDLFGQTWWLSYGDTQGDALMTVLAQAAVYLPLLLGAAVFDFRRRRF